MKKIYLFLLAAAGILAVASCAREELVDKTGEVNAPEEVTTLTFSFDATKTALVDGKTTWAAGDKIRVYTSDGGFYRDVEVPEEAVGKASFSAEVNIKDTLYFAVYPIEASKGIDGGKIKVNLSKNPDGRFDSANICVAATKGPEFQMHNVTAVLKITVNSGNVVEMLQIIAQNAIVGDYAVGLDKDKEGKDSLTFTASSTAKSVSVAVGGIDGDYYIPVLPGTYAKEFSVTALRGNGGYQNKKTTQENEVKINTLFDLGVIGDNLSTGLQGEGTAEKPFTITSQPEFIAFATSVTMGKTYEDEIVSLEADIEDAVTAPAGYYANNDDQGYFAGTFLGNKHSIKVDLDGENCKAQTYVAPFAVLDAGATIKDLKVTGTVKATGNYTAGIIGYSRGTSEVPVVISNCANEVVVTSTGDRVGGIAGYATQTAITNCSNSGAVTGKNSVGGIVGYAYYVQLDNPINTAAVTSVAETATAMYLSSSNIYATTALSTDNTNHYANGTGGIGGFVQNSAINSPVNSGAVKAFTKVGGIAGVLYWTNLANGNNSGTVTATGALSCRADSQMGQQWGSVAGGLAGWLHTYGKITDGKNTGDVNGVGGIGGIVGFVSCSPNNSSFPVVSNCENTAKVTSVGATQGGTSAAANPGTGGIVGMTADYCNKVNDNWTVYYVTVMSCVNRGDVTSTRTDNQANCVGGIVGNDYEANRQFGSSILTTGGNIFNNNENYGTVTGGYWVGGIMGVAGNRYSGYHTIANCVNHGDVISTGYSTKYSCIAAGGLVGGAMAYQTGSSWRSRVKIVIKNSYNEGAVLYKQEDYATPYNGGLVGSTWGGADIQNCYNVGNVGLFSGAEPSAAALKCLGSLIGYQQSTGLAKYTYYPLAMLGGQAMGTNGGAAHASVVGFDEKFEFAGVVTYNEVDYENVVDIMNAWVGTSTSYWPWKASATGPVFAQ